MSTFGTARLENGPDPVRGRAQLFTFGGEQVTVRAGLDKLMKLSEVAKQLHGTRMATTRIHFGLCASVKVLIAVSRRELSGDVTSCASNPGAELRARSPDTRGRCA